MPDVLRRASIADALARATERLACAGLPHARREATGLWAAIAGVKPGDVWLARGLEGDAAVADRFWAAVERRAAGVPFAYAVGRVGFRSLDLAIDRRALIPRPETEGLVDLVLGRATGGLAADVGTGSGCLALALAMEGNFARVVAVERSAAAAALARENLARARPALRAPVEIREGDLLAPLAGGKLGGRARYRLIVSNPPYLSEAEYAGLDPSVRAFEPAAALVSGADGLDATRRLLAGAAALLEPDGMLALEIDERRAGAVCDLARACGWPRVEIHDDLFGRPRYALACAAPGEGEDKGD